MAQRRPAIGVYFYKQNVLRTDSFVKKWLKETPAYKVRIDVELTPYRSKALSGRDSSDIDFFRLQNQSYNYPTLSLGIAYSFNHGVKMHRSKDPSWDKLVPVDYTSRMGNTFTVYGQWNRPLYRSRVFTWNYYLGTGIGYASHIYNKVDDIDNELIGAHLNIYFTAGSYLAFHVARNYDLQLGVDFYHHSNGALARPNKGANYLGPYIGLVNHVPYSADNYRNHYHDANTAKFKPYWFLDIALGLGGKTLLEDWQKTQFHTDPSSPDYRKEHFAFYGNYSLQADVLYRYKPRWATGVGIDVFYGDYANGRKRIVAADGYTGQISPWSVGIAFKHEVFWGRLSARMGMGYYIYRKMGDVAKMNEKKYYERIGVQYAFPRWAGISLGFSVNAHATKADFTELQLSLPIRLGPSHGPSPALPKRGESPISFKTY